jgi:hypothetical protein
MSVETTSGVASFPRAEEENNQNRHSDHRGRDRDGVEDGRHE